MDKLLFSDQMIVALLILIVLILLFGAGVVKGWIANALTMGCGFLAICAALIWFGSFFGENGFLYVLFTVGGLALALAIAGQIMAGEQATPPAARKRDRSTPSRQSSGPQRPKSIDRVWGSFAQDISLRFSPEARETARQLYDAGDVRELERFCRREVKRLG